MGEPRDDVIGVVRIDLTDVIEPGIGFLGVAQHKTRRAVEVEAGHIFALDPAAEDDQPVLDQHRQARAPGHLFDRPVLVEPSAGAIVIGLPFLSRFGCPLFVSTGTRPSRALTARRRPGLPAGREDVVVRRHVRDEVVELTPLPSGAGVETFAVNLGGLITRVPA